MDAQSKIFHILQRLPEAQVQIILDFVEFIHDRFQRLSPSTTAQISTADALTAQPSTPAIAIGPDALNILQSNGFIGSLQDEPQLSTQYKEQLDWSQKT